MAEVDDTPTGSAGARVRTAGDGPEGLGPDDVRTRRLFHHDPADVLDADYAPQGTFPVSADINGDGRQDLIVLGADNTHGGGPCCTPQPGRVFLGDGDGRFSPAPANLFPVDTLLTVEPRKVLFADFNADGRPDMFVSTTGRGSDTGEQNRLYLSRPDGGWRDATANLPQISDYSHTSAAGDISGRGGSYLRRRCCKPRQISRSAAGNWWWTSR